jgi:hypothetical protein
VEGPRPLVSSQLCGANHLIAKATLLTYAQYVDLYINQLAFSIACDTPSLSLDPSTSPHPTIDLLPGYTRLDCLWRSVLNIKNWLDHFYTMPSATVTGLPFHFWSQMILCVTILKYLTVLQDPDWDRAAVRNTVNLFGAAEAVISKLDEVAREQGVTCEDSLLGLLIRLLKKCRIWGQQWCDAVEETIIRHGLEGVAPEVIASDGGNGGDGHRQQGQGDAAHGASMPDLDQLFFLQSMDLDDDQWFRDTMGLP